MENRSGWLILIFLVTEKMKRWQTSVQKVPKNFLKKINIQPKFLVSGCKENDPVTFWFTGQTKSNSFKFYKRGSTVKKEKGLKKLNSKYPLVMRGFYWANFGETLGINSVSKDISFGSFSTSLPETSAKELKCVLLPLWKRNSKFGDGIIPGKYLHATTTTLFQYSRVSIKLTFTFVFQSK